MKLFGNSSKKKPSESQQTVDPELLDLINQTIEMEDISKELTPELPVEVTEEPTQPEEAVALAEAQETDAVCPHRKALFQITANNINIHPVTAFHLMLLE